MEKDIILKYNKPGPRYTSYPPANFFTDKFTQHNYIESVLQSNAECPQNISLYIHIPFCLRLCYFCACNTHISQSTDLINKYIDSILLEIEMVAQYIDLQRTVTQVHWGGGTPNSIELTLVKKVMDSFYEHFNFASNAEIAMECNPAYLEYEDIDYLAAMGFKRLSLGVQDFDPEVLKTVNRATSKYPIENLIKQINKHNFTGTNIDLIYGLPTQSIDSFKTSIQKTIDLLPDRVVTFSYAHVPWLKELQKKLEKMGLPSPDTKLAMFQTAYDLLTQAGYIPLGLDHYAKPNDELAIALKHKKLHRNFQGYCTRETTGQVYGFGASSIAQMHSAYAQNVKNIKQYIETIHNGSFAIERGYKLSQTEIIRREVINEIMCNGYLNFDQVAKHNKTDVQNIITATQYSPRKFTQFLDDQLLSIDDHEFTVTKKGMLIVRNIAMAFDPMVQSQEGIYSKTI